MNMMNLERVKYNQQRLGLLLHYLNTLKYRFITISPSSHQIVNQRPENAIANNVADILGWNRKFNSDTVEASLFYLMQSAKILTKVNHGWKSQLRVSSINEQLFLHSAYPTIGNEAVFFGPDTY